MNPRTASVPYYLAADLLSHPGADPVGREHYFPAVALFADVSGFTQLSEALGRRGRSGTEELTTLLSGYFETMIGIIDSYGGMTATFSGDAMTILFPCGGRARRGAVRRALQCALDMQGSMVRFRNLPTSVGPRDLVTTAGLAMGTIYTTTVGDAGQQLVHVVGGRVMEECVRAERLAQPGQIIAPRALLPQAGQVVSRPVAGTAEYCRVERLERRPEHAPLGPLAELDTVTTGQFEPYLHPAVARRLQAGQASWLNEHRQVTVLFVSFEEFDYDHDRNVGGRLQAYFARVISVLLRYDGFLKEVEIGDKGSKFVALFGAPVAHEDDEERAMQCALELQAMGVPETRIGVNSGFAYCGLVGAQTRQQYTAVGLVVNVAARLFQVANPGQVLVSEHTYQAIQEQFNWQALPIVRLKGKSEPLAVYQPGGSQTRLEQHLQPAAADAPLVGRTLEVDIIVRKMARAQQGQGQILAIRGEAGIGKSRLASEILRRATVQGFTAFDGRFHSYGASFPYVAWRSIWRGFFGLEPFLSLNPTFAPQQAGSPGGSPMATRLLLAHLERRLRLVGERQALRLPLLGPVLNLPLSDNPLTQGLDPRGRKTMLETTLVECVEHRARQGPLLFVLDDCQWIDPLAMDLLDSLSQSCRDLPLFILLLFREGDEELPALGRLSLLPHFTALGVGELSQHEAQQMLTYWLEQYFGIEARIAPGLIGRIGAQSQGNPYYLEELVKLLRDRTPPGSDPDPAASSLRELPPSLHNLIMSRIDRLSEPEKLTLNAASVIGRQFTAAWLWDCFPHLGDAAEVQRHLAALERMDVLPLDQGNPEGDFLFRHSLVRDVAYESLTHATRAELHERLAAYLERRYAAELDGYLDLLAYHYGASQNASRQRVYFERAGKAAQAAYANQAAIEYYQRLLPLLTPPEQLALLFRLHKVWYLMGNFAEAEAIGHRALALAEALEDEAARANAHYNLSLLRWKRGSLEESLAWLDMAHTSYRRLEDRPGIRRVLHHLGLLYRQEGDITEALTALERAVRLARELGDQEALSEGMLNIGLIHFNLGRYAWAQAYFDEVLRLARLTGNRVMLADACLTMGMVASRQGNYPQAMGWYGQHLQISQEVGGRPAIGMAVQTIGMLYLNQGDYGRARGCFAYWLNTTSASGDLWGVSLALNGLAAVLVGEGQPETAEPLFHWAIALLRRHNYPYWLCVPLQRAAELCADRGEVERAATLNDEAVRLASSTGHRDVLLPALLLGIRLGVRRKRLSAAEGVRQMEELMGDWPEEQERAAISFEVWGLDESQDAYRAEAAGLYRKLHERRPDVEFRRRYARLTGEELPAAPSLGELPEVVRETRVNLPALMEQVRQTFIVDRMKGDG